MNKIKLKKVVKQILPLFVILLVAVSPVVVLKITNDLVTMFLCYLIVLGVVFLSFVGYDLLRKFCYKKRLKQ